MFLALFLALGCSAGPPVVLLEGRGYDLDDLVRRHPLADDANIRADEVGRTAAATVHLVQVRSGETPHRHERHDLVVTVLRGRGTLRMGDTERPMRPGDVAVVRRGAPHWFTNLGGEPAVALVVFAPPLDAPDTTPLDHEALDVDSPRRAR
jgi:quercetin dioxygenase-like cupin family protein